MAEKANKSVKADAAPAKTHEDDLSLEPEYYLPQNFFQLSAADPPPIINQQQILYLQRTIGNQAVQRLFPRNNYRQSLSPVFRSSILMRQVDPATQSRNTISEAITLFAASQAASTPMGRRVLSQMRSLSSDAEIAHTELPPNMDGRAHDEPFDALGVPDIEVSDRYRQDVIYTALTLAHETVHIIVGGVYADEELQARETEILFYNELLQGIIIGNTMYLVPEGTVPETERNARWHARQQLIDYLIPLYESDDFITAEWVHSHLNDWGGLRNRWRSSLARYLRHLNGTQYYEDMILILESIDTSEHFHSIATMTGRGSYETGIRTIQTSVMEAWHDGALRARLEALATRLSPDLAPGRLPPGTR